MKMPLKIAFYERCQQKDFGAAEEADKFNGVWIFE
jgi:hypothetical protein